MTIEIKVLSEKASLSMGKLKANAKDIYCDHLSQSLSTSEEREKERDK